MKHFLINILNFTILFTIVIVLLLWSTFYICSSVSFKLPNEKNIIIVGDSRTECAIDDEIFSRAINISSSGTAYLYSYVKLRKFLAENSHVNKVLLSFSSVSINKSLDKWTIGDEYIREKLPTYYFFFYKEEISELFWVNKKAVLSAILSFPKNSLTCILKYISNKNLTYKDLRIGGYLKLDRDRLEMDIELRKNEQPVHNEDSGVLGYQFDYLLKIIELCKTYNVELILINTPIYNSEIYGKKNELVNYNNGYFAEVKYLYFADYPLPDNGYADITHLNYKGAEIFTQYLEDNYEMIFEKNE